MSDIQRAELAIFAAREAGPGAALDQMKAIAYCVRNRVRQGWHDGRWLKVLEHADEARGNLPGERVELDEDSRSFQRLISDIDEIYFSRRDFDRDPSGARMPDMEEAIGKCCYWAFINQPFSPWFQKHILEDQNNHRQKANMGLLFFYE